MNKDSRFGVIAAADKAWRPSVEKSCRYRIYAPMRFDLRAGIRNDPRPINSEGKSMTDYNAAYKAGESTGVFFWLFIFGLTLVRSTKTLKLEGANKKCLWSLIFIVASYAVVTVAASFKAELGIGFPLIGLAGLIGIVVGIVLAILGLAEYNRAGSIYGKKSAVWALILSGAFLLFAGNGFYKQYKRTTAPFRAATHESTPFDSEEFNFRYRMPDAWGRLKSSALNSKAALSLVRPGMPPMFFVVVAEKPGLELGSNLKAMADTVKTSEGALVPRIGEVRETPLKLDGVDGIRLESEAEVQGRRFAYQQWVGVYHGYAYEMTAWTDAENKEKLRAEAEKVFGGFEVLHWDAVVHSPNYAKAEDYQSILSGFHIKLAGSDWSVRPKNLSKLSPLAEFGVFSTSQNQALFVYAIPLNDLDPDLDILAQAFLKRYEIDFNRDDIYDQEKVTHSLLSGISFGFEKTIRNTFHYRAQVLKGNGYAYFLLAYTVKDMAKDSMLNDALARVSFESSAIQPAEKDLTSRERQERAKFLNEIGLVNYTKDRSQEAIPYFRNAHRLDPNVPVYVQNTVDAFIRSGSRDAALAYLVRETRNGLKSDALSVRLGVLREGEGNVKDAIAAYADAFSGKLRDDESLESYVWLLVREKRQDEALSVIDRYLEKGDSVEIQLTKAILYRQEGKFDMSLDILKNLRQKHPNRPEIGQSFAYTYLAAKRFSDGLKECDDLIADGDTTATVEFLKARCEFGLQRYKQAKSLLQSALKKEPSNQTIKRYLDEVSGMLGQGDNMAVRDPIDPVTIPAKLLEGTIGKDSAASKAGGFGVCTELLATAVSFKKDTEFKTTETRVFTVLDETGVSRYSSIDVGFDPLSEQIYVNEMTVTGSDGALISQGKVDDYYVLDESSSGLASQKKVLHMPVSGLKPGCRVKLVFTRKELVPPKGFLFTEHIFSRMAPVQRSLFYVAADPTTFKAEVRGDVKKQAVDGGICWSVENAPVWQLEPRQAAPEQFLPVIWISDSSPTWKTTVADYLKSIEDRMTLDDSIRKLAKEKTEGLAKPEEKMLALVHFVQKELTYKAIEFGRRARIPNAPEVTIRNRYGDCKDHALLLRQLLQAEGIKAYLVLVNAKGELREDLPSLDQFDHVITYVPGLHGGTYVDCTDKTSDIGNVVPEGLGGKQVLVLDSENPRITKIPDYHPGSDKVEISRRLKVVDGADISVNEDLTLSGACGSGFRLYLRSADEANRKLYLQQVLASAAPSVELHDVKLENLEDVHEPLCLHLQYDVKGRFHKSDAELTGQLPAVWERYLLSTDAVATRTTPFRLLHPFELKSTTAFSLPAGFSSVEVKQCDFDSPFAKGGLAAKESGNELQLQFTMKEPSGTFKAAEYKTYYDAMNTALSAIEQNVVLKQTAK